MPIVIASLVTRLNLVESKKLICENCHSGAAGIRGGRNNSVTNYILQRLIKFHFQSRLFRKRQSELREQINQSFQT